jgi:arginyl-tRNA synthetase
MIRTRLAELIAKETGLPATHVEGMLEVPPNPELGDYAFPCFSLAKELRKAPPAIAAELAEKLNAEWIANVVATGPYVNFVMTIPALAEEAFAKTHDVALPEGKVVCVESPAPNTNKPLHLGHVRNMLLGVTVRKLLSRRGHTVHAVDLVNDRGVHICKSMLAYQKADTTDTPESTGVKGDHFVGKYYVEFAKAVKENPALEDEAQAMLVAWERGDEDVRALWEQMRTWCLDGFAQTYKDYGVVIDKAFYESEIYQDGKTLILDAEKQGVFQRDETGAVYADLEAKGLDKKILLRADGTAIYITQDIALAKKRFEEYGMDSMVYVVGNEQNYHFNVLFAIFEMLGFPFAANCKHLSYGMISLPEGRMKSREGTVVDADDMRTTMITMAADEVRKRFPDLSENDVLVRAEKIGMGALRFYILKYDPARDFVYDPKESISFTGETGPYVQYTYARICSIFRKAENPDVSTADASLLTENYERQLLNVLRRYEDVLAAAADKYEPYQVAMYLLELAQLANKYYHDTQILVDDLAVRGARLRLLDSVRATIKDGLSVFSIDALEEM